MNWLYEVAVANIMAHLDYVLIYVIGMFTTAAVLYFSALDNGEQLKDVGAIWKVSIFFWPLLALVYAFALATMLWMIGKDVWIHYRTPSDIS